MSKVDIEVAEQDFQRFIDALKVNELKLKKLEEEKESVIELIEYGHACVEEDGKIIYKLIEPVTFEVSGKEAISELKFGLRRITVGEMEKHMVGKNDIEKTRRMFAYLTGTNSGLFKGLKDDFMNVANIAAFFLPR